MPLLRSHTTQAARGGRAQLLAPPPPPQPHAGPVVCRTAWLAKTPCGAASLREPLSTQVSPPSEQRLLREQEGSFPGCGTRSRCIGRLLWPRCCEEPSRVSLIQSCKRAALTTGRPARPSKVGHGGHLALQHSEGRAAASVSLFICSSVYSPNTPPSSQLCLRRAQPWPE